ncbi:Pentatricopeptide repeat protein [Penicillium bovifimosum]|uniref:Pentatricopeptide repeat protein n=1 Tax=Penicillium bovifimosum TaxID=126998 RepID=A0A9W9HDN1_9EURO|nr:Pentatricopeptide repeat protein [Penicillium bovifimosum]KAJ5143781.1 Pentatricopeptide repeat protein [Penicillium bovifimosum]
MLSRFPGSLVNRALRSRLLSAQQYRATISARRLPQPLIASRLYNDSSLKQNSRSTYDTRPDDRTFRKRGFPSAPGNKRTDRRTEFFKTAKGRAALMDIASGRAVGRQHDDDEVAEIGGRETEAAEAEEAADNPFEFDISDTPDDEVPDSEAPGVDAPRGKTFDRRSDRDSPRAKVTPKIINMELKWMTDPMDLTQRVERLLQIDDADKAAALVRAATAKGMRTGSAWVLLMRYCFEMDHPQAAFKFWNDMKKRGVKPGEKAYTAMLTGLSSATVTKSPATMKIAESIYRSISAPNSGVERSIIHTNAMLSVCHRHGDMDQLWKIIADTPEEGPNSPDTTTYTIILNAVQFASRRDIAKMSPDDIDVILQRKKQVITEGKRIWADVIWQWKNKTLELDNQVVSAMASLLLDGASDMDCYNVLELYKQTMGIPILQKRPAEGASSTRRRISREDQQAIQNAEAARQEQLEDVPFVDENNQPLDSSSSSVPSTPQVEAEVANVEEAEDFSELFSPVVPDTEGLEYLRPDSKELTHILSACFTMTQGLEGGQAYWSYLTLKDIPHRFEPDTYTYIQYFRLLRLSRSSKVCVKTLRDQMIPSGQATGLAFHLALSVCRRDRRNSSILLHTNELMSLMDKVLVLPELRVLDGYLSIIQKLADSPSFLLNLRGLEDEASDSTKEKKKSSLPALNRKFQVRLRLTAINVLRPYILQLHTALESVLGLGHLDKSPRYRFPRDKEGVEAPLDGTTAVKLMASVRLLVDETLHLDASKNLITKAEREALAADSARLKKYSGRQTIEALQKKKIYPTSQQLQEGRQRIREYLRAAQQSSEPSWGSAQRKAEAN